MSMETYKYKRAAIKAAKELGYPTETIEALSKANNDYEICQIMTDARKAN
jgi:hypothetical protein